MRILAAALALLATSTAHAEPPAWDSEASVESCASSYDERLADARDAVRRKHEHDAERAKALPAIAWFREHCRYLSDLEIAIRKLDFEDFVCDTKKGRPKNLTSEIVDEYEHEAQTGQLMKWSHSNLVCRDFDLKAGRPALNFPHVTSDASKDDRRWTVLAEIEVLCWKVESESCAQMRATTASWKPKPSPSARPQ